MFIWDFVASAVFDQLLDWIHAALVDLFSDFFTMMNGMGVEIFEFTWVQALLLFFEKIAWALYAVGLVLAMFETAIAYQNGRGSIQNTALNLIKGFFAASLVTTLPVEAYKFAISLQGHVTQGLTGLTEGLGTISISNLSYISTLSLSAVFMIFLVIALGYAVIKVFFANLKRGGILLIQIAVGTLYMISIPRGFTDAFTGWCKHVIGLCLTAFLQTVILTAGLLVFKENLLLGVGLMLSASEIPRITEQFGMDTSIHGNVTSALYAGQAAFSLTHTILRTIK